jgi:hypothetical protein
MAMLNAGWNDPFSFPGMRRSMVSCFGGVIWACVILCQGGERGLGHVNSDLLLRRRDELQQLGRKHRRRSRER